MNEIHYNSSSMFVNLSVTNCFNEIANRSSILAKQQTTFQTFKIIVDIYVVLLLAALGIVGNVVSFIILGRDRTVGGTTGYLLQSLAVTDVSYLICSIFIQSINTADRYFDWFPAQLNYYWAHVQPIAWTVASVTQTSAVWIVVLVTADRWLAITRPLQAQRHSTRSRVRVAVLLIWLLSLLYNIPRYFEREVKVVEVGQPEAATRTCNETVRLHWTTVKTAMRNSTEYVVVYDTICFSLCRFICPLILLIFLNAGLIQALRRSHRLHSSMRESQHRTDAARKKSRSSSSRASGQVCVSGQLCNSSIGASGQVCVGRQAYVGEQVCNSSSRVSGQVCVGGQVCKSSSRASGQVKDEAAAGVSEKMKSRHSTVILVVVVAVFAICELPDMSLRIYLSLRWLLPYDRDRPLLLYINVLSNLLLTINASINFIIYIVLGRKFRAIFCDLFCSDKRPVNVSHVEQRLASRGKTASLSTTSPRQLLHKKCSLSPRNDVDV